MKALAWAAWIVVNLAFLGMCGFFYILCSQFWSSGYRHAAMETFRNNRDLNREHHVQYYSEVGAEVSGYNADANAPNNPSSNSSGSQQSVITRDGPGLASATEDEEVNSSSNIKSKKKQDKLLQKIAKHKSQLMIQLRRVMHDESSVFKARGNGSNPYNVEYSGPRTSYDKKTSRELVCAMKKKGLVQTVHNDDEPFKSLGLGSHLPSQPIFRETRIYNSCAVVSSAGSLYGSNLGRIIDKHQVVVRFNHAPTREYDADVGHRTTLRIVNSQVVTKSSFNFLESPLYRDIKILAWDPSKYNHSMNQWYRSPDHDLFHRFFEHRLLNPDTELHLLNPSSLWNLWNFIQEHTPLRIRRNPPSSGFLGLALLLPQCAFIDMFEFIPSMRMTKRCHYYENAEDLSCTFGVWHPLSAEKMLMFAMNIATDTTVFRDGYIRVPGFNTLNC